MTPTLKQESLHQPQVLALIRALNAELDERYPEEGANHFRLDPDEVAPGRGAFLMAYAGDEGIGCGAVRLNEPGVAEIKRMYVVPSWRGRGVAGALLAELEAHARALGAKQLVLETGARQPESIAVYRRAGFVEIPRFGDYVDSPLSVCMGKQIASAA
jgi:putative acetyltransferase